jgi:hypothetical protein
LGNALPNAYTEVEIAAFEQAQLREFRMCELAADRALVFSLGQVAQPIDPVEVLGFAGCQAKP